MWTVYTTQICSTEGDSTRLRMLAPKEVNADVPHTQKWRGELKRVEKSFIITFLLS